VVLYQDELMKLCVVLYRVLPGKSVCLSVTRWYCVKTNRGTIIVFRWRIAPWH